MARSGSMMLVTKVISRIERPGGPWLYLDCGVYNALFEALPHQGRMRYPVTQVGSAAGRDSDRTIFVLAGPTGDAIDVIDRDVNSRPQSVREASFASAT